MANTYIVQYWKNGKQISSTLLTWCKMKKVSYDTVVSRIYRADPDREDGVYFFAPRDRVLKGLPFVEGKPKNKEKSPSKKLKGTNIGTAETVERRKAKQKKQS